MTAYHLFRETDVIEAGVEDEPITGYIYYGTTESNSPEQAIKKVVAAARTKGRFYAAPARSWKGLEVESKVVLGAKQLDFVGELEAEAEEELASEEVPAEPPVEPPIEPVEEAPADALVEESPADDEVPF